MPEIFGELRSYDFPVSHQYLHRTKCTMSDMCNQKVNKKQQPWYKGISLIIFVVLGLQQQLSPKQVGVR
jgi:hypothetical protein